MSPLCGSNAISDTRKNWEGLEFKGVPVHGAVRGIEDALLADLQQQLFSVVRIFLDDAVLGPVEPHVAVAVDGAAVEILRAGSLRRPRN